MSYKKESDFKRACIRKIKDLRAKGVLERFWYYCPMDVCRSGIPDFIFCINGRFRSIELKMPKGKISPIQRFTYDEILKAGGRSFVCSSMDEFISAIEWFSA